MADGENERLGSSAKKQAKYGTTTKAMFTNERFYKYNINPGDTLQGIALKLGVTVCHMIQQHPRSKFLNILQFDFQTAFPL